MWELFALEMKPTGFLPKSILRGDEWLSIHNSYKGSCGFFWVVFYIFLMEE